MELQSTSSLAQNNLITHGSYVLFFFSTFKNYFSFLSWVVVVILEIIIIFFNGQAKLNCKAHLVLVPFSFGTPIITLPVSSMVIYSDL